MPEGAFLPHTAPTQTVVQIGCDGCPNAGWCGLIAEGRALRSVAQRPLLE